MKRLLLSTIGIALVGALLYFNVFEAQAVRGHRAARGSVVREALGSGSIESRRIVGAGFEVSARVAELLVDQGDAVTIGQELARLDDQTFRAEISSARREVALAQSTQKRLEADIERAEAVLEGARDSLRRIIPLVEAGTASEEKLDLAQERVKVAVAELSSAQAALVEGEATISVAQARLDRTEVELERSVLRSPFDGVVVLREREVGDVAVPGSPVLRLAASDTIWSSVWVDETHLDSLRVGLPARLALRSDPEHPLAGRVARIGREVDRQTRELLVDVAFDEVPEQIVFGQRVDAWIELSRSSETLRIPAGLLVRLDGVEGVFVAEAERARFRPLELGARGRGFLEVRGGLDEGQMVLEPSSEKRRLKNGDRIRINSESAGEDAR